MKSEYARRIEKAESVIAATALYSMPFIVTTLAYLVMR